MTDDSRLAGEDPGLGPGELQSRALRGATWSSLSSMVSLPLAIAVSVVLARSLGPEQFARFAYLTFLVPLLFTLSDLGFSSATTRAASQAFAAGDLAATRQLLGKTLGWNVLRVPLLSAIAIVVAQPGPVVGFVIVVAVALSSASAGLLFALHAENRGAANAKLAFLQGVAAGVSSAIAALAGASGTTVWAINMISGIVATPGYLLIANPALRRAALIPRLPRGLPGGFWRYGVTALAVSLISTLVFSRSEIAILEALGEHQALAVFALAFGLAQRLTAPVDTLLGPLTPALSALAGAHPDRMQAGFGRALRLSAAGVAFLAAAAGVGTMLVAPVLFGAEYEGVGPAFLALAAVTLIRAAVQPYIALAHAIGRPGILMRANLIALLADVAIALALIPPLGLWGAVLANVAGGLLALGLMIRMTPGAERIAHAGVPVARLIALATASSLAAYGFGLLAGELHPGAGALVAFVAGTACFLALASTSGGLLPADDAAVLLRTLPARLPALSRSVTLIARRLTMSVET